LKPDIFRLFLFIPDMKHSFLYDTDAWIICSILFVLMTGMVYLGLFLRHKTITSAEGLGPVEASLFGLLALLLAFTFGEADSRFDARRRIITTEANNIGTAILRADMYADSDRIAFRKDFARYVEARLNYYEAKRDEVKVAAAKEDANTHAASLWKRAASLSKDPANLAASNQMIPALNAMIDITTEREAASKATVPESILLLLFVISLCCSFFIGYCVAHDKRLNRLAVGGFIFLTTIVIYVIMDLDRPRRGIINLDSNQQYIRDLRTMLK